MYFETIYDCTKKTNIYSDKDIFDCFIETDQTPIEQYLDEQFMKDIKESKKIKSTKKDKSKKGKTNNTTLF